VEEVAPAISNLCIWERSPSMRSSISSCAASSSVRRSWTWRTIRPAAGAVRTTQASEYMALRGEVNS